MSLCPTKNYMFLKIFSGHIDRAAAESLL
jgi:hypothetical protein